MLQIAKISIFLILIIFKRCAAQDDGSLSLSIAGMINLLHTEKLFLQHTARYADELYKKWQLINSTLERLNTINEAALVDPERYLANPLNAFTLMRRMHYDTISWLAYMEKPVGEAKLQTLQSLSTALPSSKDFEETIVGIIRLQVAYGLQPQDMAEGLLDGVQHNCSLTAIDCFSIGRELTRRQEYNSAADWLFIALKLYAESPFNDAMNLTRLTIIEFYTESLQLQNGAAGPFNNISLAIPPEENCCRSTYINPITNLYCVYNSTTTFFLTLAPLKMEILSLDPYIVVYYDVISDREIDGIKSYVSGGLSRSQVIDPNGDIFNFEGRTSKTNVIDETYYSFLEDFCFRLIDMSGLSVLGSEQLQVMNYGLGGHYTPHIDPHATVEIAGPEGDRVSTIIYYLSDVEQGGATVFPNLGISVPARKGTALLWYNLDNRGDNDIRLLHSGCPVLFGSKWIAVKWIRYNNQLYLKPCYKED